MATFSTEYQAIRAFDHSFDRLVGRHGFSLARADESFVSYDGAGTIAIASNPHLDEDDTLAQIVLHELCHYWTEGPASRHELDWGLSNLGDEDLSREYAALRVQYALLRDMGLEFALHPTTQHRWFYECLLRAPNTDAARFRQVVAQMLHEVNIEAIGLVGATSIDEAVEIAVAATEDSRTPSMEAYAKLERCEIYADVVTLLTDVREALAGVSVSV